MTQEAICLNPVVIKQKVEDPMFNVFVDYDRADYINQRKLYTLDLEITAKCAGSCLYCHTGSTAAKETRLPKEKVFELIDEGIKLGIRQFSVLGGDPLAHPDWYEIASYGGEKGLSCIMSTSGLISKKVAKQITQLGTANGGPLEMFMFHISTLDQSIYNILHSDPKTLELKIQGYKNILEAGFPPDRIMGCIPLMRPAIKTMEETFDWYLDEMGCIGVCFVQFKTEGLGAKHPEWEPTKEDRKHALEYRAKRLGEHWLKIGSSDGGFFYCRTNMGVKPDGTVCPCLAIADYHVGNVYQQSLTEIFEQNRDTILFNHEIRGFCGSGHCENSDICNGCRSNAYHCLGDVHESDPTCFLNPDAKEFYFQERIK